MSKHVKALREAQRAGALCSNVCFNLKQRNHLTEDQRNSCADVQKAWDRSNLSAKAAVARLEK